MRKAAVQFQYKSKNYFQRNFQCQLLASCFQLCLHLQLSISMLSLFLLRLKKIKKREPASKDSKWKIILNTFWKVKGNIKLRGNESYHAALTTVTSLTT